MEWKRYRSIVQRWFWLLVLAVFLAVVASWIYMRQTGHSDTLPIVVLVALGGLVWGLIGILGVEYLTDNVLVVEDLRHITGKRILARVPARTRGPRPLFEIPGTTSATAYQMAGIKILPPGNLTYGRTVLVCSPQATPYSAQLSANLGAVYAGLGHPTLLIDADRIDSELSKALNVAGLPGFSEAISSPSSDIMLHVVPSVSNLYMLPAGAAPLSKQMTFSMPYLRSVVERSGAQGSMIVISGPPVTADGLLALGLAKSANDVVLAVVVGETKRRNLRRAVETLEQSGAHLAGIVFLDSAPSSFVISLQMALAGSRKRVSAQPSQPAGNRVVDGQVVTAQKPVAFIPANVISADSYASRPQVSHSGQQVRRIEVTASDITDAGSAHPARNRPAGPIPKPSPEQQTRPVYDPGPARSMGTLDVTADSPSLASGLAANAIDLSGLDRLKQVEEETGTQPSVEAIDISGLDLLGGELATGTHKSPVPLSGSDRPVSIDVPVRRSGARDLGSLDSLLDFSSAPEEAPADSVATPTGTPEVTAPPPAFAAASAAAQAALDQPFAEPAPPAVEKPVSPLAGAGRPSVPAAGSAPGPASASLPPELRLPEKLPASSMQSLAVRSGQLPALPVQPAEEPAPAPGVDLPGTVTGLFAVVGKWIAAQRLAREVERSGNPSRKRRSPAPESGAGTRIKLAGAYAIRTIATRQQHKADAQTLRGQTAPSTTPLSSTAAQTAGATSPAATAGTSGPRDAQSIEAWLREAEHARRAGDYREAKILVNKVLDRDPRNEAAWNLHLALANTGPAPAMAPLRAQPFPVPMIQPQRKARVPAWLAALVVIAVLGGLAYLGWPQISKLSLPAVFVSSTGGTTLPTQVPAGQVSSTPNPDAGYEVKGEFLTFWDAHGGSRILGKPISPRIEENGENGVTLQVQYFERARLELHPEIKDPAGQVTLGRLGVEVPVSGTLANPLPQGLKGNEVRFNETGFDVPQKFYDFWKANNGITVFGYPLTPVLIDAGADGTPVAVQYFERARMEYHADKAGTPDEVQLTNLGTQVYAMRHPGQ